jgi:hypothetical protein
MLHLILKDNARVIIRLLIFTLIALAPVTFWQSNLVTAQDTPAENPKTLNSETQSPSLKGQEAIEHLQKTGVYDSLTEAVRATKAEYSNLSEGNSAASVTFTQSMKLEVWEHTTNDGFGRSVSISGDTAVIGGSKDGVGAAFVFVRSGTTWLRQQVLFPSDAAPVMHFGYDVYIEGNTIAVSGNLKSVYIFTRTDNIWTEEAKLDANDGVPIGGAAISGNRIIVGAVGDNGNQGAAYIFVKNGGVWTQEAKLIDSERRSGDDFGGSVGISGDTAIVGARFDHVGSVNGPGAVFVFVRNGSNWIQQARLTPSDGIRGDKFGGSVAIEGDTAVVGAIGSTENPPGAAYIYVRNGTTWTLQTKLARSDAEPNEEFGSDVDIDGDTVIVGAMRDNVGGNSFQGSAYVFSRTGNVWTEQSKLIATDGRTYELLGYSVAISGGVAIAGQATFRFENKRGAAYIFTKTTAAPDLQATSDTGISNTDNITNKRNLSFNINDVSAGATVQLFRDDQLITSTTATENTVTLTDISAPANGTFRYSALQIVNNVLVSQTAPLEVTIDTTQPTVFITKATNQPNPTNAQTINFVAAFSEPVTGFDKTDISLAGSTANVSNANVSVTGEGAVYQVVVSGVISDGQILQTKILEAAAQDVAGNLNSASTNTDNTVTVDNVNPTVTINQAANQADPAASQPINFTVVFSEPVLGFTSSDVSLIGSTANTGGANIVITGDGRTFNVSISNVTSSGQVQARINAQSVQDRVGNPNIASTSTDNIITVQIPAFAQISGRVLRVGYRGTYIVRLVLTAANGQEYYAKINSFGYYRFVNIPTGNTTIRVITKKSGSALTQNFFLTSDTTLNF